MLSLGPAPVTKTFLWAVNPDRVAPVTALCGLAAGLTQCIPPVEKPDLLIWHRTTKLVNTIGVTYKLYVI